MPRAGAGCTVLGSRKGGQSRGCTMNKKFVKSGIVACSLISFAGLSATQVLAQSKQLSDKSVRVLMDYAWTLVPGKFTTPDGSVIITDKKNRKVAMVPMEVAREAIRVGRLSAHAQICDLPEEQAANFHTFMRLERNKKKWNPQQMLFINQLHLFTVMWLSGQAKLVSTGSDKPPKVEPQAKPKKIKCTKENRKNVRDTIIKYLLANPPPKKAANVVPVKQSKDKKNADTKTDKKKATVKKTIVKNTPKSKKSAKKN